LDEYLTIVGKTLAQECKKHLMSDKQKMKQTEQITHDNLHLSELLKHDLIAAELTDSDVDR